MEIQYIGMAAALGLSAIGSGFGAGAACLSSVGSWKKCYASGKPSGASGMLALMVGLLGGLSIGLSAYFQGRVAASASDALGETGKGTANYFIVIGIVETVALFTLVFCLLLLQ